MVESQLPSTKVMSAINGGQKHEFVVVKLVFMPT